MLAIARALMSRPAPAAARRALARPRAADRQADLRRDPRAQPTRGLTVFLVEQNAFHALKLAHRGYVMVNGVDHHVRHRQGAAGAARGASRLSRRRPALMQTASALTRRPLGLALPARHRDHGRLGAPGMTGRASRRPGDPAVQVVLYMRDPGGGGALHPFALFEGTLLSLALLPRRSR